MKSLEKEIKEELEKFRKELEWTMEHSLEKNIDVAVFMEQFLSSSLRRIARKSVEAVMEKEKTHKNPYPIAKSQRDIYLAGYGWNICVESQEKKAKEWLDNYLK